MWIKQARTMLMRAYDVGLPARLSKSDLDRLAAVLVESADEAKQAGPAVYEARPRTSAPGTAAADGRMSCIATLVTSNEKKGTLGGGRLNG